MAQRKRVGLITQRSEDRNLSVLLFGCCMFRCERNHAVFSRHPHLPQFAKQGVGRGLRVMNPPGEGGRDDFLALAFHHIHERGKDGSPPDPSHTWRGEEREDFWRTGEKLPRQPLNVKAPKCSGRTSALHVEGRRFDPFRCDNW